MAESKAMGRPSPGKAEAVFLPSLLVWAMAGVVFLLTASNGEPHRISSGYYVALIAPAFILVRGVVPVLAAAESEPNRPVFYALLMFTLANLVSTIITPTEESIYALIERCVLPLLVYVSMVGIAISPRDLRTFVMAVALGALVMFARGLLAYYREFGIPDLQTLLWSRYNLIRIAGYERATLGNVTHMGNYVVLVLPILAVALVSLRLSRMQKVVLSLTIVLGLCNLVIAGSRAGMLVMMLMSAVITYCYASRRTLVIVTMAMLGTGAVIYLLASAGGDLGLLKRFAPGASGQADGSVVERLESMIIGWEVFLDNALFGVGPAMSPYHNSFGIPHQSILHQLSELGLVGGLAFIWLNFVVLDAFRKSIVSAAAPSGSSFGLLWLIGPAGWLIAGLFSGIAFNMSIALVWVGIAHAMLAINGATVLGEESRRPSLSVLSLLRSLRSA